MLAKMKRVISDVALGGMVQYLFSVDSNTPVH